MSNSGDDLKTLRNTLGMTQEEVADLAGISLRSYKFYENEPQKKGTHIYKYILELLQKSLSQQMVDFWREIAYNNSKKQYHRRR